MQGGQRLLDRRSLRVNQWTFQEINALNSWSGKHLRADQMIAHQCDEPETGLCAQRQGYHSGSPNDHPNATEFRGRPLHHV